MSSSSSSSGSGSGCLGVAAIIFILWAVSSQPWAKGEPINWSDWSSIQNGLSNFFVQSNPFPVEQAHVIEKIYNGIETRSWSQYKSAFEPGAQLIQQEPGLPGKFEGMEYKLLMGNDLQTIVGVKGKWVPSALSIKSGEALFIDDEITVVRAKKDILGAVELGGGSKVNLGVEFGGWFVQYDQKEALPYNYSARGTLSSVPSVKGTFIFGRDDKLFLANEKQTVVLGVGDALGNLGSTMWSPDGKNVIFSAREDTNGDGKIDSTDHASLYAIELPGLTQKILLSSYGDVTIWSISPDSRSVAVSEWSQADQSIKRDFHLLSVDGTQSTHLSEMFPYVDSAGWSTDGKRVALVVATADTNADGKIDYSDSRSIFVLDAGGDRKQLAAGLPDIGYLSWSPDNTKVAFSSGEKVRTIEVATEKLFTAGKDLDKCSSGHWSPDSRIIVFSCQRTGASARDVWRAEYDGAKLLRLTSDLPDSNSPAFSPDGKRIVFSSNSDNREAIYVMDADGTNKHMLLSGPNSISSVTWSPNGSKFAFSATWYATYDVSKTNLPIGMSRVYVVDENQNDITRLTSDTTVSSPIWLSDTTLALARNRVIGKDKNQKDINEPYVYVVDVNKKSWKWQNPATNVWQRVAWTPVDYSSLLDDMAKRGKNK